MADAFKLVFNTELVNCLAQHFSKLNKVAGLSFDKEGFIDLACNGLDELELKARSTLIQSALSTSLQGNIKDLCRALPNILHPDSTSSISAARDPALGLAGWSLMPVGNFLAEKFLNTKQSSHEKLSLNSAGEIDKELHTELIALLECMRAITSRFSAEFCVRPLIAAFPNESLSFLTQIAESDNEHERRWSTEGCRPRLPWGIALPKLIRDPSCTLPILNKLAFDDSLYVRTSVANHLNDYSREHPDHISSTVGQWKDDFRKQSSIKRAITPAQHSSMLKRACRNNLKNGHPATLSLFGFNAAHIKLSATFPTAVKEGESAVLNICVSSTSDQAQPLMIDYELGYMRANGRLSFKVFKGKEINLAAHANHQLQKTVSFKPVTTRRYYPGKHLVRIKVNGKLFDELSFDLL